MCTRGRRAQTGRERGHCRMDATQCCRRGDQPPLVMHSVADRSAEGAARERGSGRRCSSTHATDQRRTVRWRRRAQRSLRVLVAVLLPRRGGGGCCSCHHCCRRSDSEATQRIARQTATAMRRRGAAIRPRAPGRAVQSLDGTRRRDLRALTCRERQHGGVCGWMRTIVCTGMKLLDASKQLATSYGCTLPSVSERMKAV